MTTPISIPAQTLRTMLTAVLPHAGRDDSLPALAAVRFEVRDGVLYLVACDRYTIGVARERIVGAKAAGLPDQAAGLPLAGAEYLHQMLEGVSGIAAIVIAEDKFVVDAAGSDTWPARSWPTEQWGTYPDWRALLAGMLAAEPGELGESAGIDQNLLARFVIDPGPHDPEEPKPLRLRIAPRENAPIALVTHGSWFLGAVTATRCTEVDARSRWSDWTAALAEPDMADATK
jgi:DNA polymerase III beta subunit, central domain